MEYRSGVTGGPHPRLDIFPDLSPRAKPYCGVKCSQGLHFPAITNDGPFPYPGSLSLSHSLCHPSIGDEHLRASVKRSLHASLAPSTRRTYQAGVKHFLTFTLMHVVSEPKPNRNDWGRKCTENDGAHEHDEHVIV